MRGYTLLETVIYVAILAIISILTVGSILAIYQSFGRERVERHLVLNGDTAIERILREIRRATSTDAVASTFGSHPGVFKTRGGIRFGLSGNTLQIQEGSSPAANLTSSKVDVTNLVFYSTSSPNSTLIKVEMILEAGSGVFLKSKNFYGSAVMRGAY